MKQYVIRRFFRNNKCDYYAGCTEDGFSKFSKHLPEAKLFSLCLASDKLITLIENQIELCMKKEFKYGIMDYADLAQPEQNYFIVRYIKDGIKEYYSGKCFDDTPLWSDFYKNAQTNDFETSKKIKERLDNLYYGLATKPEIHIVGCV